MSSLLYGALARKREEANAGKSKDVEPPGIGRYADALSALIPAEVRADRDPAKPKEKAAVK